MEWDEARPEFVMSSNPSEGKVSGFCRSEVRCSADRATWFDRYIFGTISLIWHEQDSSLTYCCIEEAKVGIQRLQSSSHYD